MHNLCKLNVSKKNISDMCKISEVTINKCFKKFIFKYHWVTILTDITFHNRKLENYKTPNNRKAFYQIKSN